MLVRPLGWRSIAPAIFFFFFFFFFFLPHHHLPVSQEHPVEFPSYGLGSAKGQALQEDDKMLGEGVFELDRYPGSEYYCRLFLVQKVTRSLVSIIVTHIPFRMETVSPVFGSIRKGDVIFLIYLWDAYFQVPIHPDSVVPLDHLVRECLAVQGTLF